MVNRIHGIFQIAIGIVAFVATARISGCPLWMSAVMSIAYAICITEGILKLREEAK